MFKQIPSNPNFLLQGEELHNLLALRYRFRTALRTILQAEGVHPVARRKAEAGLQLDHRESIVAAAKDIAVLLEQTVSWSSVAYIAKRTIKIIAERR